MEKIKKNLAKITQYMYNRNMKLSLDKPISFCTGSHRYFYKGERYVNRVCPQSVLLLVYDGVLAFSENGEPVYVKEGEYYIQRAGLVQRGDVETDSPKYYYVHFCGDFSTDGDMGIRGKWNEETVLPLCEKLDMLIRSNATQMEKTLVFYMILRELNKYNKTNANPLARTIMDEINKTYKGKIGLKEIAKKLYVSTNYLISVFKKEYGLTPHKHLTNLRLEEARRLLLDTTRSEEEIAFSVGFSDFSVFYKAFIKNYGCAPGTVRNKNVK
mgnify:CR=1 FL=1